MIELIPAIDIIEGRCVRLTQGDYAQQKIYDANPVDIAKAFEDCGVQRLHMVDLDGAKSQHVVNLQTIEAVASQTSLTIDFGGGIKSREDLLRAFNAGAAMVTVGSIAVSQPDLLFGWIAEFGASHFILGADTKNGVISTHGWKQDSNQPLLPFIHRYAEVGVSQVLCTDIAKDGMLQGPSTPLYEQILAQLPDLYLIASGGVSNMDDIDLLERAHVPAVVFGKAFYEGHITLHDIQQKILHSL